MNRKAEIQGEIERLKDGLKRERKIARYADRSDPRSARVIRDYLVSIAALQKQADNLNNVVL